MGVIKRGILGGFSNKVGNIVGSTWKGRAVIKSLPLSVANPRTTPQTNQRTKFKTSAIFFGALLSGWVKPLWDRFSGDISGYNAIMKLNVENFSNSGDPDFNNLVMSKGKMMVPELNSLSADSGDGIVTIEVTMPNDPVWGQPNSSIYACAINGGTGEVLGTENDIVATGAPFTMNIVCKPFNVGENIFVYIAVKRADGTQVSDSVSDNTIAVA